jgi:ABC-type dipeptide/oligopeptide/nickel transport system ATPase component
LTERSHLLIEQNPKLAAEVADRLATMVKGRIVDSATLFVHCHHGPLIISVSSVAEEPDHSRQLAHDLRDHVPRKITCIIKVTSSLQYAS